MAKPYRGAGGRAARRKESVGPVRRSLTAGRRRSRQKKGEGPTEPYRGRAA